MRLAVFSRSLLAGLLIALCGISPTMAQAPTVTKDLAKTSAGIYTLDKSHVSVLFKISHLGFSMYHGRFNAIDGKLNFDPKFPEKSVVDITIDTGSVDTNNEKLQAELKGEKFFNTSKFPTATFKSLHTTRSGDSGTMIGELTMLGVTKPVTLNVTFRGTGVGPFSKKETLGFSATGTISRSAWGMNALEPMIGDDVQIDVEAEFNYSGAAPVAAPATPVKPATATSPATSAPAHPAVAPAVAPAATKDDAKKK